MSNPALNLKLHAVVNLILAIFCFIFQIASLATSPQNQYEAIGIGFWGAIILALTAIAAYKTAMDSNAPFFLGFTLAMGILSFFISFSILGIFSASIDFMHRYPNNCTVTRHAPPCGDYSPAREGFDAMLLICGLIGIPTNGLIVLTIFQLYSPPATPAT